MRQQISLITSDIPVTAVDGFITINTDRNDPILQYCKNEYSSASGKKVPTWIPIDGSDSPLSLPSKMSDLEYLLRKRDWGIHGRFYMSGSDLMFYDPEEDIDPVPQINPDAEGVKISGNTDTKAEEEFDDIYKQLMITRPKMNINEQEVDFGTAYYYGLLSSRDLVRNISVIDLVEEGGSKYTNILNLGELIERTSELSSEYADCSCLITVGVEYTKSGVVYKENFTFEPFRVESGALQETNIKKSFSGDVTLEFVKLCLRLFPDSLDVTECIISNCHVVYYGGLI
jgi:hypothetical protein